MNSFKILIAAGVIIFTTNALAGCSEQKLSRSTMSELGMARIEAASEYKKTAEITLQEISRKGNLVHLQLILDNPDTQPITSVQAWLSYNPKLIKGLEFQPNEKDFDLMAPYPNGFDAEKGLLKFGRSTTSPLTSSQLVLSDLTFQSTTAEPVRFEAYDYQYDLTGHTSVNMMREEEPINILLKPQAPLYTLN